MKCPRCIETMEPADIVGYDAWSCIYCRGHWVELQTLEQISNKLSPEQDETAGFQLPDCDSLNPGNRVCPMCPNTNLHVLKSNELELDLCKTCKGLFFDDGQLERAVGEIPEKEGISPLAWVLVGLLAKAAMGGAGGA